MTCPAVPRAQTASAIACTAKPKAAVPTKAATILGHEERMVKKIVAIRAA